ncbi:MAG TPA: response regulator [Opitutaceae bacterium]|jgi:DNA-binding response OmpR family regulator|nr:response regulator transcription factor [Opitutaceae bacterium]HRE08158.1 response regulator [Opitutaceae bacterium]
MVLDVTTSGPSKLSFWMADRGQSNPVNGSPQPLPRVRTILVLDDDASVRHALVEFMRRAGYDVASGSDGEEGWNALRAGRHDLLITDHDMPRLKGLDLLRRMRSCRMDMPTILVSGAMPWDEPDMARVLHPGTAMEKPFRLQELLANVRALLR